MAISTDKNKSQFKKKYLGDVLMERGLINYAQLNHALMVQEKQGGRLGEILVDLGYVDEHEIVVALVVQFHIPYIAIDKYEIDESVIKIIPEEIVNKYHVVPLDRVNRILSVVMANPLDDEAKIELQQITNCRLMPFIASQGEIKKAIHRWYHIDV